MCSIFGSDTKCIPAPLLTEGFERTVSRGPDMSAFIETKSGYLGFHRLAIMGLDESGMQPFEMNGNYVVCNGELYGFRQVRDSLSDEIRIRQRIGLRNSASAVRRIRSGYVPHAGRGICADSL